MDEPVSQLPEDSQQDKESADVKPTAEPDLLVGHTMSSAAAHDDPSLGGMETPDSLQKSTDSLQDSRHSQSDDNLDKTNLGNKCNSNSNDSLDDSSRRVRDGSRSRDSPESDTKTALRLSRSNLSGKESASPALSPREKDRADKIRQMKEKQQRDQERKVEELREANRVAQETRDRQLEERRKKLEEIRRRDNERRQAVEERRRQADLIDKERREIVLKKQAEREQKIESMKLQFKKEERPLAFGSRTPREICLIDSSLQRSPSLHFFTQPRTAKKRLSRSVPPRSYHCCFPPEDDFVDRSPGRPRPKSSMGRSMTSSYTSESPKSTTTSTNRRSRSTQRSVNFNPRSRSMGAQPMTPRPAVTDKPKIERKTPTPKANLHPVDHLASPKRTPNPPSERAERPPSRGPVKVMPTQPVKKISREEKPKKTPEKPKPEKAAPKPKSDAPKAADTKAESKREPTAEELEYKAKLAEKRREAREKAAREAEEAKLREASPEVQAEDSPDNDVQEEPEPEVEQEEVVDEEAVKEAERLAEEAKKAEEERLAKAIAEEEERKRFEAEKAEEERIQKEEQEKKAKEEADRLEAERLEKQQKEEDERNERKKRLEMIMKRVKNDSSPVPRATSPAPEPELGKVVDTAIIENASRNLKSPEPGSFKSAYLQNIMQKRQQAAADKSGDNSRSESPDKPENDQITVENGTQDDHAETASNGPATPEIQDAVMKPIENESESTSSVDSPSADRSSDSQLDQVIHLDNQANLSKNGGDLSDIINFNTELSDQPTTLVAFEADNNAIMKENATNEVEVT